MDIIKAIHDRRTIRQFNNQPVDTDLLVELLEVASYAPNHKMREPWELIMYNGDSAQKFVDVMKTMPTPEKFKDMPVEQRMARFEQVPCFIVVSMKMVGSNKDIDEDYAACCAFIQTFQLAAWAKDLGVVWKTDGYIYKDEFKSKIGLSTEEQIVGIMQVGYFDTVPALKERTPIKEKLIIK